MLRIVKGMEDTVLSKDEAEAFQHRETMNDALVLWAVHERSGRHPLRVFARPTSVAWHGRHVWPFVLIGDTVDEVRRQIPERLSPMPARPDDPASLVETWF